MTAIPECPEHGPMTEYRNLGGKVIWIGCLDCFRRRPVPSGDENGSREGS